MDRTTRVFFERQGLHYNVIVRVCRSFNVHKSVDPIRSLEQVRIGVLAELTLEISPEERRDLWCLFTLHLQVQPVLEAGVVDESHCP